MDAEAELRCLVVPATDMQKQSETGWLACMAPLEGKAGVHGFEGVGRWLAQ